MNTAACAVLIQILLRFFSDCGTDMDEDDNEDDYVRPRLYSLKKEFAIKCKSQSRESRIQHTSTTTTSKSIFKVQ